MDKHIIKLIQLLLFCTFFIISCSEKKDTINVAVASNFEKTLEQIVVLYQQQRKHEVNINIIAASSGVLSSQIINNAPFDLFLSADNQKPHYLKNKLNINNSVSVYAIGQLALWIPGSENGNQCLQQLTAVKTLAIANPKTAPYGKLALKIIQNANINIEKTIHTASVSQVFLYTHDRLSQAGFVAYPMLDRHSKGCIQIFQDNQLSQSMLLLNDKAKDLYQFILTEKIQNLIKQSGYNIFNINEIKK